MKRYWIAIDFYDLVFNRITLIFSPKARHVIVSIKSSDGEIHEVVVVYNTANGYKINYSDGSFKKK